MESECLGKNRSNPTNPLRISALTYGYWLSGRDRSLNKNSLCSSRRGRSYSLKHHVSPIKETFHGCAHRGRKLLSHGVIYGNRLGLILEDKKKKKKRVEG